jgi:hypothetical protein
MQPSFIATTKLQAAASTVIQAEYKSVLILVGCILIRIQLDKNDPQEKIRRCTAQAPKRIRLTTHHKTALAAADSGTVFDTQREASSTNC